jgi:hypothetical protein
MRKLTIIQYLLTVLVTFDGILLYVRFQSHFRAPWTTMGFFSFLLMAVLPALALWRGEERVKFQIVTLVAILQALIAIMVMRFLVAC